MKKYGQVRRHSLLSSMKSKVNPFLKGLALEELFLISYEFYAKKNELPKKVQCRKSRTAQPRKNLKDGQSLFGIQDVHTGAR
jgi:hypothetical protein